MTCSLPIYQTARKPLVEYRVDQRWKNMSLFNECRITRNCIQNMEHRNPDPLTSLKTCNTFRQVTFWRTRSPICFVVSMDLTQGSQNYLFWNIWMGTIGLTRCRFEGSNLGQYLGNVYWIQSPHTSRLIIEVTQCIIVWIVQHS